MNLVSSSIAGTTLLSLIGGTCNSHLSSPPSLTPSEHAECSCPTQHLQPKSYYIYAISSKKATTHVEQLLAVVDIFQVQCNFGIRILFDGAGKTDTPKHQKKKRQTRPKTKKKQTNNRNHSLSSPDRINSSDDLCITKMSGQ